MEILPVKILLVFLFTFSIALPPPFPPPPFPSRGPSKFINQKNVLDLFSKISINNVLLRPGKEAIKMFLDRGLDLKKISEKIPRNGFFSSFDTQHREAIMEVAKFLKSQDNSTELFNIAKILKDRPEIHPKVWFTALMESIFNRTDLKSFKAPAIEELFPSTFVPYKVMNKACESKNEKTETEEAQIDSTLENCVRLDGTIGEDNGLENKLWYFREDIQMNANHWLWHSAYPGYIDELPDRRGELFYYYHTHFISRYIMERITNDMPPLVPLDLRIGTIVKEGYNSHLNDTISGRKWSVRANNVKLEDLVKVPVPVPSLYNNLLLDLTRSRDNLIDSLEKGYLTSVDGTQISLTPDDQTDTLAKSIEAVRVSINPAKYGVIGIHGFGHNAISWAGEPFLLAPQNVMGDVSTAVRDITFYRLHGFIDNIFKKYKSTLKPYALKEGKNSLIFNGVKINKFEVHPEKSKNLNELGTFWNWRSFTLSRAVDFQDRGECPTPICSKHLDHEEFKYELEIENENDKPTPVTVRIFLAPRFFDSKNTMRISYEEQRNLMFPLDAFKITLDPKINKITRHSTESALTIPWLNTFKELESDVEKSSSNQSICGCGWPHHMLLPKGTKEGSIFDLFVMITNGVEDMVEDEEKSENEENNCYTPYIGCGLAGKKYPDSKPMGYPFDRRGYIENDKSPKDLDEYVSKIPNAKAIQIKIYHEEEETN